MVVKKKEKSAFLPPFLSYTFCEVHSQKILSRKSLTFPVAQKSNNDSQCDMKRELDHLRCIEFLQSRRNARPGRLIHKTQAKEGELNKERKLSSPNVWTIEVTESDQ